MNVGWSKHRGVTLDHGDQIKPFWDIGGGQYLDKPVERAPSLTEKMEVNPTLLVKPASGFGEVNIFEGKPSPCNFLGCSERV